MQDILRRFAAAIHDKFASLLTGEPGTLAIRTALHESSAASSHRTV